MPTNATTAEVRPAISQQRLNPSLWSIAKASGALINAKPMPWVHEVGVRLLTQMKE
jgi:hypothetical protein